MCFVVGCAAAAMLVHREDLVAVVVMPPLVYVVLALAGGLVERDTEAGGLLTRQAVDLLNAVVLGAPVLLTATGAALVVAVVRGLVGRPDTAPRPVEY